MVVMEARTQQVLVDQLFSVPKCVRLARISERSNDLLTKIIRAVPKRSEGELQDVVGENFKRLSEGNVSELQKKKVSGTLPTEFPAIDEKDDLLRIMTEVELLPDQNQPVSIVVVNGKLAVRLLEANAGTSEQEKAVPTPEQLSKVMLNNNRSFQNHLQGSEENKAIERMCSMQRLMPWFLA